MALPSESRPPVFEEAPSRTAVQASRPSLLPFVALIAGNAMLAVGPWMVRLAAIGPIASGFWRLAIALPVLVAVTAWQLRGQPAPSSRILAFAGVAGLFFAFDLASWHAGILRTRLANATLFGNVTSFFFVAYGFLVTRSLPSRGQAGALLLAVAGVALLLGRSYELSPAHVGGDLLCLAGGLFYTGYMIGVDRSRGGLGTIPTLTVATATAAMALLPLALIAGEALAPVRWWPLVALAVGSQLIGQGLLVYAIGALPPIVVGLGLLTQPAVAAAIGWIAYDERLGLPDLAGALAIAAALVLVRRRAAR